MNDPSDSQPSPGPALRKRPKKWILILGGFLIFLISAGLYFGPPIFLEAKTEGKRAMATAFANQIGQSITSYYYDNSSLPVPSSTKATPGGTVFSTDSPEGVEVLNLLSGHGPRGVKYLTPREAKANKDGATFDPSGSRVTGLYDPWGNPYLIVMDTNYEERIIVPFKDPVPVNGRRCAVYSAGQDGVLETKDDIRTWP